MPSIADTLTLYQKSNSPRHKASPVGGFFFALFVFSLYHVSIYPQQRSPARREKMTADATKNFSKKIIPFSVCLRIDSGSRDRDSGTRPSRRRKRKHDRQKANGIPRRRAKRKDRLHGKSFHVQHPLFRAGKNRKRREVTAQQVREGLRLTPNYLRQDAVTILSAACGLW